MKSHTYYDILGVTRDATTEEITAAKNALAKVYHPDANIHKDIDTTAFMQEILEAYRVLSDPEQRELYNREVFGETNRVFRTFTVGPEKDDEETGSFVTYWNTASQLNDIVRRGLQLMELEPKKNGLSGRLFKKSNRKKRNDEQISRQIAKLSAQAVQLITVLRMAGIPMQYWNSDAMNWMLVRWGQKQSMDYKILFTKYDNYIDETKSGTERLRIRNKNRQFHSNLKKLLSYTLEA